MSGTSLAGVALPDLFSQYAALQKELRRRKIIRTNEAPAGGWAEHLIRKYVRGGLAPKSTKSWDVLARGRWRRIQVKARVVSDPPTPGQRQLSSIRSFSFDTLAIVLLTEAYGVWRAVLLPVSAARANVRRDTHVRGYRLIASNRLLNSPAAEDITAQLQRVAQHGS